jgi:hypothetical protein
MINPLISTAIWTASWWLLAYNVLSESEYMKKHNKTKWLLTWAATVWCYFMWSAATPFLLGAWVTYALWKPTWDYWKEIAKGIVQTPWWAVWWLVKWWAVWMYKWAKKWFKREQKLNPVYT